MSLIGLGVSMPMPAGVGVAAGGGGGGGGFSPLDLSPTMWFDASDETTITESSGAVSQWDDKSGNGYNLVQATSSAQPKTGTTTINSLNVLEYDGSNTQYLDEHTVNVSASHTMFAVYEISSNDGEVILVSNDSQSYWAYAADEGSSSTTMKGNNTIGGLYIDGSEWTGTTRGDLFTALPKDSPSLIRATFTFPQLGWSTGFTGTIWAFSNGTQVAEIIVVASPTAQEISDTETYLANKWGITL